MNPAQKVQGIVFEAIEKFNQSLPRNRRLEKSPGTTLLEGDQNLDSLEFLNLASLIEKNIAQEFKIPFTVFDVNAMAKKKDPFRTVESFLEYLGELLEQKLAQASLVHGNRS